MSTETVLRRLRRRMEKTAQHFEKLAERATDRDCEENEACATVARDCAAMVRQELDRVPRKGGGS